MNPCANAPLRISVRLAMTLPNRWQLLHRRPGAGNRYFFKHSRPPGRRLSVRHPLRHQPATTALYTSKANRSWACLRSSFQLNHYVEKDTLVQQLQAANVALELHSSTDELTQLPNRRALFKQLALRFASARAQQQQVSLIFIDLDGFKAINDRFGHPCGDSFLVQVGKRLTAVARREDIVGRLGGDEFLIVGSAQQPAAQQAYVTSLRQALCGVYFLGEQRIDYEGASFGVVTCDPQSIDVEAALRTADEAMYQDKKSRRQENFIHID